MLMSISAHSVSESSGQKVLEPGNRVAVKHGRDEYFVGTVVKTVPTGVRVKYDDNGDVVLEKGIVVRLQDKTKTRKKSITSAEVKLFRYVPTKAVPTAGSKKVETVKADKTTGRILTRDTTQKSTRVHQGRITKITVPEVAAPISPTVATKPIAPPVGKDTTNAHYNASELSLVHKTIKQSEYMRYGGGNQEPDRLTGTQRRNMLTLLGALHTRLNRQFFGNKLPKCDIRLLNNTKQIKSLGLYEGNYPGAKGRISIHPRVFVSTSPVTLVTVMAHEMAHQYVWEVQHIEESQFNKGHGPNWTAAMAMCGLEAAVYASQDTMKSMKTEDQLLQEKAKALADAIAKETYVSFILNRTLPETPVQWFDSKSGQWQKGISCGPENGDSFSVRSLVLLNPRTNESKLVPNEWLYLIPRPENQLFLTQDFLARSRALYRFFQEAYDKKLRRSKSKT